MSINGRTKKVGPGTVICSIPGEVWQMEEDTLLWDTWMEFIDRNQEYWDDLAREFAGMKKSEQ